jgi:hypothetical protein
VTPRCRQPSKFNARPRKPDFNTILLTYIYPLPHFAGILSCDLKFIVAVIAKDLIRQEEKDQFIQAVNSHSFGDFL